MISNNLHLISQDILTKKIETMCGHVLVQIEIINFWTIFDNKIFSKVYKPKNLDIFTYINSKFVYVEKHISTQISQLYWNVLQQQCKFEQKILKNAFATHRMLSFTT